jgi:hypothetical protein
MKKKIRELGRFAFILPYAALFIIGLADGQGIQGAWIFAYVLTLAIEALCLPYIVGYIISAICFLLCIKSGKSIENGEERRTYINSNVRMMACMMLWFLVHLVVAIANINSFKL